MPEAQDTPSLLDQDIACPGCGYNLRGLGGQDVACPECGRVSNLPQLLTRRWDKPWYRAPGYNKIALPAAWLLIASLLLLPLAMLSAFQTALTLPLLYAGWLMLSFILWGVMMAWVFRSMAGLASVGFALLGHVALAGYMIGVPMFVAGLVWLIAGVSGAAQGGLDAKAILFSALPLAAGIVLFLVGRWIERAVARHCIRLYLERAPG